MKIWSFGWKNIVGLLLNQFSNNPILDEMWKTLSINISARIALFQMNMNFPKSSEVVLSKFEIKFELQTKMQLIVFLIQKIEKKSNKFAPISTYQKFLLLHPF